MEKGKRVLKTILNLILYILLFVFFMFIYSYIVAKISNNNVIGLISIAPVTMLTTYMVLIKKKLNIKPIQVKDSIIILKMIIAIFISNIMLSHLLPTGDKQTVIKITSDLPVIVLLLFFCIIVPICEEMFFRQGFKTIFASLSDNKRKNNFLYIIISSVLFGLLHYNNMQDLTTNIVAMASTTISGLITSYVYAKYDNLSLTILFHSIINLLALI